MTFATALRSAMTARGLTIREAAALAHINAQTVSNIVNGRNEPAHHTAVRLSAALDWPQLAYISEQDRRRRCAVCRQRFVTVHRTLSRRRYCGEKCQQTAWRRKLAKGRATVERKARYKLTGALGAIADFCRACEPVDRVCKMPKCELREFSPLPLIQVARRVA